MVYSYGKVKLLGSCMSERKALAMCLHFFPGVNADCAVMFLIGRFE